MQVIQTHLKQETAAGAAHMVTWLPIDRRVKPGSVISLLGAPGERWTIDRQYQIADTRDLNQRWGLALPKSQRIER